MAKKLLVAYGSKHGATAEIAAVIGEELEKGGFRVDVRPAAALKFPTGYEAVVLGSAVYAGMWRKDVVAFLTRHEMALSKRPVWFFSSGPTGEGDPVELVSGWRFPRAHQEKADRIQPRDYAVFHGNIDKGRLNLFEKLIVKLVKAKEGDFRDWDAIRAWAANIATELSAEFESM